VPDHYDVTLSFSDSEATAADYHVIEVANLIGHHTGVSRIRPHSNGEKVAITYTERQHGVEKLQENGYTITNIQNIPGNSTLTVFVSK